jgi:hypothetical protein
METLKVRLMGSQKAGTLDTRMVEPMAFPLVAMKVVNSEKRKVASLDRKSVGL